jgi:hypothetical protein
MGTSAWHNYQHPCHDYQNRESEAHSADDERSEEIEQAAQRASTVVVDPNPCNYPGPQDGQAPGLYWCVADVGSEPPE